MKEDKDYELSEARMMQKAAITVGIFAGIFAIQLLVDHLRGIAIRSTSVVPVSLVLVAMTMVFFAARKRIRSLQQDESS